MSGGAKLHNRFLRAALSTALTFATLACLAMSVGADWLGSG